jgi:DNA-binding HxlR family transcriptional regulator
VNDEAPTGAGLHPRAPTAWTPLARTLAATGDRWTLMIALALAPGRMRLSHLHSRLPGVSTGVLERYVQQMVAHGLVSRTRFKEMPPRVELELTGAGRELLPIAYALARWGMRHMWSPPRERERVELDALLRMLPALLEEETGLPEGLFEAVVADASPPVRCVYRVDDGRLRSLEDVELATAEREGGPDGPGAPAAAAHGEAMTRVDGDSAAWVAALGPAADHERLRISGDERLARRILDALPRSA